MIRTPSVAGSFYPAEAATLAALVRQSLARAQVEPYPAKALIVPHAGYIYSGEVAASGYAAVAHLAPRVRRVVLIGPAHRLGFRGIALPTASAFATPLGLVALDQEVLAAVNDGLEVRPLDLAFDGEHDLEVQLPFLQTVFPEATVVPLLVGAADPARVERLLEQLWGGPETLIVVSSDLSHYHDHASASRLDLATTQAIEALAPERLAPDRACGALPIVGLLRRAAALDLRATTLDRRTSGDTAGDHNRVVGYASIVFEPAAQARLSDDSRQRLLTLARETLELAAAGVPQRPLELNHYPWPLRALRKTFVTLEIAGQLRGCIGSVVPNQPLVVDVAQNVGRAALSDPRFGPVRPEEVATIDLTIAILSHPRPIPCRSEIELLNQLQPDIDGLILRDGNRSALFLPKVWHALPQPLQFVRQLKQKAGLAPDHHSPTLQAFRFTTESF